MGATLCRLQRSQQKSSIQSFFHRRDGSRSVKFGSSQNVANSAAMPLIAATVPGCDQPEAPTVEAPNVQHDSRRFESVGTNVSETTVARDSKKRVRASVSADPADYGVLAEEIDARVLEELPADVRRELQRQMGLAEATKKKPKGKDARGRGIVPPHPEGIARFCSRK